MEPALGELGCYLSHVAVMRALLASSHRFALVLEDDVLLTPALRPVLQGLLAHAGPLGHGQAVAGAFAARRSRTWRWHRATGWR
jgi:hypothetical protein